MPDAIPTQTEKYAPSVSRASALTPSIAVEIDDMFEYHAWTDDQKTAGSEVRHALAEAVKVIVANVPPSADRTTAIRKIREARMDANSAITHNGKY